MSSNKDGYYSVHSTPKLENRLHKAAFNGKLEKVKRLIAEGINIYEMTALNESILFISIARDHDVIANVLLDIYENDLKAVEDFFFARNVQNYFWLKESILVAYGEKHIEAVKELANNLRVKDSSKMIAESKSGLIILLKPSNSTKSEVMWLTPQKTGDDLKIAEIIELIYPNGCINIARKEYCNQSFLDVTAYRQFPELYFRLLTTYEKTNLRNVEIISHFCYLCRKVKDNHFGYFQGLLKRLNKFDVKEVLAKDWSVLTAPLYLDQFDIFEYFLDAIADHRMEKFGETKSAAKKYIIDNHIEDNITIIQCLTSSDRVELAVKFLKYDPELLTTAGAYEITLFTFICNKKPNAIITKYIVDHFDEIQQKGLEEQTIMRLINSNWVDAIKILYQKFPRTRNILFKDHKKGIEVLLQNIDERNYEITNFLVEVHRDQLTSPKDIIHLIHYCVYVNKSHDILKTLLSLPNANAALICEDQYHKSPLHIALKYRHLQNYHSLIQATNPVDIIGIKEADGDNLLTMAIWFKEPVIDEEPFVYIPEPRDTLEIVDSSDDEDVVTRKTDYNKNVSNRPSLYPVPIIPDDFYPKQEAEYNAIFEYFISIGIDFENVNLAGENLIHSAVKFDNVHILNRLLDLEVNPNAMDEKGNKPIHLVKGVAVFRALLDKLSKDILTEANTYGQLPLHTFVKDFDNKSVDLLLDMIQSGADVNAIDKLGNTPLLLAQNVEFCKILLANGADITAVNASGQTAVHAELTRGQNRDILKFLLKQRDLNLLAVDESGVSILAALVIMSEEDFNEILPDLEKRPNMLDELFRVNCNGVDHCGYPVFGASFYNNSYCIRKLLGLKELDIKNYPAKYPAIEAAISAQEITIVQRLIELGANLNGDGKCTVLQHALGERRLCRMGDVDIVKLLLKSGAKPEWRDVDGVMAVRELSNDKVSVPIVAALIRAGADYRIKDENGRQPLEESIWKCLYEF